jgi:hypothetical protein
MAYSLVTETPPSAGNFHEWSTSPPQRFAFNTKIRPPPVAVFVGAAINGVITGFFQIMTAALTGRDFLPVLAHEGVCRETNGGIRARGAGDLAVLSAAADCPLALSALGS